MSIFGRLTGSLAVVLLVVALAFTLRTTISGPTTNQGHEAWIEQQIMPLLESREDYSRIFVDFPRERERLLGELTFAYSNGGQEEVLAEFILAQETMFARVLPYYYERSSPVSIRALFTQRLEIASIIAEESNERCSRWISGEYIQDGSSVLESDNPLLNAHSQSFPLTVTRIVTDAEQEIFHPVTAYEQQEIDEVFLRLETEHGERVLNTVLGLRPVSSHEDYQNHCNGWRFIFRSFIETRNSSYDKALRLIAMGELVVF